MDRTESRRGARAAAALAAIMALALAAPEAFSEKGKDKPREGHADRGDVLVGQVVGVHDGDTLTLLVGGKTRYKVRFEGIDAPELAQDYGKASKQCLSGLAFGKTATAKVSDVDRYGRAVARVFVDDLDMNLEMVKRGFAWHYREYSKDPALERAETGAREAKLGLWKAGNGRKPVPPWDYRRTKAAKRD